MQHSRLVDAATSHVSNILLHSLEHSNKHSALVVYDDQSELARIISASYRHCLPTAQFINFDAVTPEHVREVFTFLKPGDLVVLIQSTNFRLEAYRIRVELFKRQLKVIEHPHLGRMHGDEIVFYVDALAYDPSYYRTVGPALKTRIDSATQVVIDSGMNDDDTRALLYFDGGLEPAKLNIGNYQGMTNVGGQYPIGEVFTEAKNLELVHGIVRIFVFGDTKFAVNKPEKPITLTITKGRVTAVQNSTAELDLVLTKIAEEEGEIWLRELGFGMNRAFSAQRMVCDIGTYERMCGIHLSLGAKHGVYNKPEIRRAHAKYHIDVFPITESVILDKVVVYRNRAWIV